MTACHASTSIPPHRSRSTPIKGGGDLLPEPPRSRAKLEGKGQPRSTPVKGGGDLLLSGLLVCGHCHAAMMGNRDGKKRRIYNCGTYHLSCGRRCHRNAVLEDDILDLLVRKLQADFINPDSIERTRALLREEAEATRRNVDP
jgi:hypothetical protein